MLSPSGLSALDLSTPPRPFGSLVLKRERDLTRTIVDRGTDSAGQGPLSAARPGMRAGA
ncbi:hypothetical protein GCM10022232_70880 [Streptomyces plumbiresistens]|uniref:Uncharacterized protein n=1 Tax=Streptomyces plumbiresistens TaxID=511811 RepID=A0ABP7SVU9_9ACTN